MGSEPCLFEAVCRKAMLTRGSVVTIRTKPFGITGYKSRTFLIFLEELGCRRIKASRAYKMVCPKEVLDKLCQGFYYFYTRLKELGFY
jgi:hypothetical protein